MDNLAKNLIIVLVNHKETVVVVWFLIVAFILYRACWNVRSESSTRSNSFHFVQEEMRRRSTMGLDWEIVNSLPVYVYKSQMFKEKLECSICLSEFAENEVCKLLPNCNHSFHTECIDMWLFSHDSCPLCKTNAHPSTNEQLSTNVQLSTNAQPQ
ncbi:hypothetical protein SUGI_0786170 [Cryptomeria japonica]|nr:hypothetical protein SUGI_0786170 [Cryptomeria japonica]